ncbi:MAG TPA: hypothetical protein VGR16_05850 [Thermomicrobiales bacterium]|nr:hypothetical protein [Thermomicrobiales bacterium]
MLDKEAHHQDSDEATEEALERGETDDRAQGELIEPTMVTTDEQDSGTSEED